MYKMIGGRENIILSTYRGPHTSFKSFFVVCVFLLTPFVSADEQVSRKGFAD
jgi:hypothetical protein